MTRGTSDRLRANMDEEATRLAGVAAGYRMAGDGSLALSAQVAADTLRLGLEMIDRHQQREAAALRTTEEMTS
jgi:hypothetical protein